MVIFCRNNWKIYCINFNFNNNNDFECFWCLIKIRNFEFYVGVVYYLFDLVYFDEFLLNYLFDSCEKILLFMFDVNIIIVGDIN